MPLRQIIEGGRVPVKVFTEDVEAHARQPLANVAQRYVRVEAHLVAEGLDGSAQVTPRCLILMDTIDAFRSFTKRLLKA